MRRLTDLYRDPVMGTPYRNRWWFDALCCAVAIGLYVGLLAWSVEHPAIPREEPPSIFVAPPPAPHADPPPPIDDSESADT